MHSGSLRSMEEECFETKVKNRMRSGGSEFVISWMSKGGGGGSLMKSRIQAVFAILLVSAKAC